MIILEKPRFKNTINIIFSTLRSVGNFVELYAHELAQSQKVNPIKGETHGTYTLYSKDIINQCKTSSFYLQHVSSVGYI